MAHKGFRMELIELLLVMLKDPSVPSHRVARKTAVLTVIGVLLWVFYRHVTLGFAFGEPVIVTIGLAFMWVAVIGIFGGIMAGAFYDSFLQSVGAQNKQLTLPVFFAEWLFAATSPLMGFAMLGIAGQDPW